MQIPPYFGWDTVEEADPALPHFWEAQTLAMDEIANSYMVVISDIVDGNSLHPKSKRPAGERMALRALKNTYGFSGLLDSGPIFRLAAVEGSRLRLHFDEIGSGLAINTDIAPKLTWFEVCDADGNFADATATIDSNDVLVSSPAVSSPVGVRYAWSRYAIGNLMNKEGLPARLFRQTSLDINSDGGINFEDFDFISRYWLSPCADPNWCEGADLNVSKSVDEGDVEIFNQSWISLP